MFSAFFNCFKIPELRHRIIFTLCVIVVVRIGAAIPCPGVNTEILTKYFQSIIEKDPNNSVIGLFNLFSGGALENCAVFTLGIIPYISASIMLQLMTAVIPSLSKLAREEGGRQKITQYTRYATIVICLVQGYFYARVFEHPDQSQLLPGIGPIIQKYGDLVSSTGVVFEITTMVSLLSGTLLLMWLGEQITDKGSATASRWSSPSTSFPACPPPCSMAGRSSSPPRLPPAAPSIRSSPFPMMLVFLFGVIAGTIAITQAMRKITINYARQVRGNKVYGGQSFLPLKVNYSASCPSSSPSRSFSSPPSCSRSSPPPAGPAASVTRLITAPSIMSSTSA